MRPPPPSLRTELLAAIGVLAAAALLVAVAIVVLFGDLLDREHAAFWLATLVSADVLVFILFGAYHVRRLVLFPIGAVVEATEAIANGDLSQRVPAAGTHELTALATSINRMTDRLLTEQTGRVRIEKMATVGRLAAGIAHEIGNPLAAMNGYTHIVRRHVTGNEQALDALDGLDRESSRIDRIVRGLLDYARPRAQKPSIVRVNDVVRGAVGLLRDQGILRRMTVRLLLDDAEPALFGERHELEQVFVNLLLNAVDAASETGELVIRTRPTSVEALRTPGVRRIGDASDVLPARAPNAAMLAWLDRVAPGDGVLQVIVADSGTGVAEEDAERIFDPFFTTKEPGRGTGLGLAIVARIVEGLRGAIWVQRAREGGAAFVLLLPLVREGAGARTSPELPAASGTPGPGLVRR